MGLQLLELVIERNGQADGGGGQQVRQEGAAGLINGVGNVHQVQDGDDHRSGNENGVQNGPFPFFLAYRAEGVGNQSQAHGEKGTGREELMHFRHLPFCG